MAFACWARAPYSQQSCMSELNMSFCILLCCTSITERLTIFLLEDFGTVENLRRQTT